MIWQVIICLIVGYLIGTISTGYIVGKFRHMDIRDYGSGNAGTTNAFRTMGRAAGVITFIGDFLKAYVPIILIRCLVFKDLEYRTLLEIVYGFGCVIGHNYPVWLGFKGGKGIAVTGGVFVALDPWILPPGVIIFAGLILLTKYVSVGSLAIATLFPIWIAVRKYGEPYYIAIVIVAVCYTISAFYRHKANIVRLKNGTENKIGQRAQINKTEN